MWRLCRNSGDFSYVQWAGEWLFIVAPLSKPWRPHLVFLRTWQPLLCKNRVYGALPHFLIRACLPFSDLQTVLEDSGRNHKGFRCLTHTLDLLLPLRRKWCLFESGAGSRSNHILGRIPEWDGRQRERVRQSHLGVHGLPYDRCGCRCSMVQGTHILG